MSVGTSYARMNIRGCIIISPYLDVTRCPQFSNPGCILVLCFVKFSTSLTRGRCPQILMYYHSSVQLPFKTCNHPRSPATWQKVQKPVSTTPIMSYSMASTKFFIMAYTIRYDRSPAVKLFRGADILPHVRTYDSEQGHRSSHLRPRCLEWQHKMASQRCFTLRMTAILISKKQFQFPTPCMQCLHTYSQLRSPIHFPYVQEA